MTPVRMKLRGIVLGQIGWFIVLWICGVAGTVLLALPFRLLVAMAMFK